MGYDLIPRKKTVQPFSMGAFSWIWMLEQGCGLPFKSGPGPSPGSYVYNVEPGKGIMSKGNLIHSNDGVYITSKEAKQMACLAGWIADYWTTFNSHFSHLPEQDKRRIMDSPSIYRRPVREDFIEKVRAFSEWAPKSGGFRVC